MKKAWLRTLRKIFHLGGESEYIVLTESRINLKEAINWNWEESCTWLLLIIDDQESISDNYIFIIIVMLFIQWSFFLTVHQPRKHSRCCTKLNYQSLYLSSTVLLSDTKLLCLLVVMHVTTTCMYDICILC